MAYKNKSDESARKKIYYQEHRVDKLAYEKSKPVERILYNSAKQRARQLNIPINIEPSDIIVPTHCPYLGVPLVRGNGIQKSNSPSIDRIVPELGYTKGNVEIISLLANRMKQNATPEQQVAFAKEVLRRYPEL